MDQQGREVKGKTYIREWPASNYRESLPTVCFESFGGVCNMVALQKAELLFHLAFLCSEVQRTPVATPLRFQSAFLPSQSVRHST